MVGINVTIVARADLTFWRILENRMQLYLDTEFTTLDPRLGPKLISIGIVDQDLQRTFYAELSDSYSDEDCDSFVLDEILPILGSTSFTDPDADPDNISMLGTKDEVGRQLADWIKGFDAKTQILSDAPGYDVPLLKKLLGRRWPASLSREPINVMPTSSEAITQYEEIVDEAYRSQGLTRHNAMDDAFAMRHAHLHLAGCL